MKDNDCYVVGIGCSAGGMDSLFSFFSTMPAQPEIAFVIVRHLKRDHKSDLGRFLSKYTSIPIHDIRGGETVRPNTIYLMPENTKVIIRDRRLFLTERPKKEIINNAIDTFFHSLAEDVKDKAIGIVMSGYMSDGAKGATTIEEHGGIVMVENPATAKVSSMPLETIRLDHPDYVLSAEEMPAQLLNYIEQKELSLKIKSNS